VYHTLSLLGNGSVNTFQRQRRIVGTIVFYAIRRRSVLPRTSCYFPGFILGRVECLGYVPSSVKIRNWNGLARMWPWPIGGTILEFCPGG
jgi:hypothetical protein